MHYSLGRDTAAAHYGVKLSAVLRPDILAQVRPLLRAGRFQEAGKLVGPGAYEPKAGTQDLGHLFNQLGAGGEGVALLMAHPKFGINATKLYHPEGLITPMGIERKGAMIKQLHKEAPDLAQHVAPLLGQTSVPGEGSKTEGLRPLRVHHFGYVPGESAKDTLTARPELRGKYEDTRGRLEEAFKRVTGTPVNDLEPYNFKYQPKEDRFVAYDLLPGSFTLNEKGEKIYDEASLPFYKKKTKSDLLADASAMRSYLNTAPSNYNKLVEEWVNKGKRGPEPKQPPHPYGPEGEFLP